MIIYDTVFVTPGFFNCRYNPRMDYAFCLLILKSSIKGDSHYLVLHATSMTKFYHTVYYFKLSLTQISFIYCHLYSHVNLLTMVFSFNRTVFTLNKAYIRSDSCQFSDLDISLFKVNLTHAFTTIVNFLFWRVTFLWPHHMEFTFPI